MKFEKHDHDRDHDLDAKVPNNVCVQRFFVPWVLTGPGLFVVGLFR